MLWAAQQLLWINAGAVKDNDSDKVASCDSRPMTSSDTEQCSQLILDMVDCDSSMLNGCNPEVLTRRIGYAASTGGPNTVVQQFLCTPVQALHYAERIAVHIAQSLEPQHQLKHGEVC